MVVECALPRSPPLVSLIVLTCNRPLFLAEALRAAASQTYRPLEAIVVDDGPHAIRPEAIKGYGVAARLVRLHKRASIGAKRNAGLRSARGAVILHWDDGVPGAARICDSRRLV